MQDINSVEFPREMRQKTEHVDRLSKLPDSILTHILSFLPTRKAIQTSLLAKRYRNLWASVPVLDFHFHDSHPLDEYAEKRSCECEEKFVKFVDGVFEHREPLTLDALKLVLIDDNSDFAPATTWLDSAAMLKPKFLSAKILTEACTCCFEIPESVFTSESLQKLVLKLSFDSISPRYVNLPNLKMLSLSTVSIEDGAMEKLSSGLTLLEEMVLCNCILNSCSIYSSTMKRLVLDNCHSEITSPPDILISIPSLAFLKIHNCTVGKLKFKKLESLVKAQIHCTEFSNEEPLFLTGLLNVTSLKLVIPMDINDALKKEISRCPTFHNLKNLKIGGWCMRHDFDLVACFIHHAPNLKELALLCGEVWSSLKIRIQLGNCIEILKINYQEDDKSARKLVESVKAHLQTIREAHIMYRRNIDGMFHFL